MTPPRSPAIALTVEHPDERFDQFLDAIKPMTPAEQYELLLHYLSGTVERHTNSELQFLHEHLRRTLPQDAHSRTLLELIEGKIALRTINNSVP